MECVDGCGHPENCRCRSNTHCSRCGLPRLPFLSAQIGGYCTCNVVATTSLDSDVEREDRREGERRGRERRSQTNSPRSEMLPQRRDWSKGDRRSGNDRRAERPQETDEQREQRIAKQGCPICGLPRFPWLSGQIGGYCMCNVRVRPS